MAAIDIKFSGESQLLDERLTRNAIETPFKYNFTYLPHNEEESIYHVHLRGQNTKKDFHYNGYADGTESTVLLPYLPQENAISEVHSGIPETVVSFECPKGAVKNLPPSLQKLLAEYHVHPQAIHLSPYTTQNLPWNDKADILVQPYNEVHRQRDPETKTLFERNEFSEKTYCRVGIFSNKATNITVAGSPQNTLLKAPIGVESHPGDGGMGVMRSPDAAGQACVVKGIDPKETHSVFTVTVTTDKEGNITPLSEWFITPLWLVSEADQEILLKITGAESPLLQAVIDNNIAQVKQLIADGVNVDGTNENGTTALHKAAQQGRLEIVKLLIEAGANLLARNANGTTARQLAKLSKKDEVATFLEAQEKLPHVDKKREAEIFAPAVTTRRKFMRAVSQYPSLSDPLADLMQLFNVTKPELEKESKTTGDTPPSPLPVAVDKVTETADLGVRLTLVKCQRTIFKTNDLIAEIEGNLAKLGGSGIGNTFAERLKAFKAKFARSCGYHAELVRDLFERGEVYTILEKVAALQSSDPKAVELANEALRTLKGKIPPIEELLQYLRQYFGELYGLHRDICAELDPLEKLLKEGTQILIDGILPASTDCGKMVAQANAVFREIEQIARTLPASSPTFSAVQTIQAKLLRASKYYEELTKDLIGTGKIGGKAFITRDGIQHVLRDAEGDSTKAQQLGIDALQVLKDYQATYQELLAAVKGYLGEIENLKPRVQETVAQTKSDPIAFISSISQESGRVIAETETALHEFHQMIQKASVEAKTILEPYQTALESIRTRLARGKAYHEELSRNLSPSEEANYQELLTYLNQYLEEARSLKPKLEAALAEAQLLHKAKEVQRSLTATTETAAAAVHTLVPPVILSPPVVHTPATPNTSDTTAKPNPLG